MPPPIKTRPKANLPSFNGAPFWSCLEYRSTLSGEVLHKYEGRPKPPLWI